MGQVISGAVENQINNSMYSFIQQAPDFYPSPENCAALLSYIPDNLGRVPNANELRIAFARGLYDGTIQRTPQAPQPLPPRPNPAPMLNPSAPVPSGQHTDDELRTMPMNQLRDLVMRGGR